MKSTEKLYSLLQQHIPDNAVHYCLDKWTEKPFHFTVTRKRNTKLGDYRFDPRTAKHSITVNHNLNKFNFLITFLHEYAHLTATDKYDRKVSPHGAEWKKEFKEVIQPMLNSLVFPDDILQVLIKHMKNPKASTQADARLVQVLRKYDDHIFDDKINN